MEKNPTISIIMPFYNVEQKLFLNCIKSIIEQKYRDFELIIINDGSNMKFNDVLNNVKKMDSRIHIFRKENGGVSTARNAGVKVARGKYIAFVDADDILNAEYLTQALWIIKKENADYIIGATYEAKASELENITSYMFNAIKDNKYQIYEKNDFDKLIPSLTASNCIIHFANGGYINRGPVARLLKTDIARKVNFPEGILIGEDVIWNQKILKECLKVGVAENIWYYYLQNSSSAVHKYRENAIEVIQDEGMSLFNEMDISKNEIYRAFCSKLLSETRLIICRGWLTRKENKENFFSKYKKFARLRKMKPWSYITGRYSKIGDIREKVIYFLFKSNLYFPIVYFKDKFDK